MENHFEKQICLGTGISFLFLSLLIVIPNGIVLMAVYKNPLRCFRRPFSVFLRFIPAVDFLTGAVVCIGQSATRLLCAFNEQSVPIEGNFLIILQYIGLNSSVLLVTAMSVDRLIAVVFPHFYLRKVKPRHLFLFDSAIIIFSVTFASLQLYSGISADVYRMIDQYLHAILPLSTSTLCYMGIFFTLRKQSSRIDIQRECSNPVLHDMRQARRVQMEKKFVTTSFFILLSLVVSLIPYLVAIIIEAKCHNCAVSDWYSLLINSSIVFLFLNSAVNPFLTMFRINELNKSVKIVLQLRQE